MLTLPSFFHEKCVYCENLNNTERLDGVVKGHTVKPCAWSIDNLLLILEGNPALESVYDIVRSQEGVAQRTSNQRAASSNGLSGTHRFEGRIHLHLCFRVSVT